MRRVELRDDGRGLRRSAITSTARSTATASTPSGDVCGVTTTSGLAWKIPGPRRRLADSRRRPLRRRRGRRGRIDRTRRSQPVQPLLVPRSSRRCAAARTRRTPGWTALKRIKANTIEKRLLNARGEPNFNINFYVAQQEGGARRRHDVRRAERHVRVLRRERAEDGADGSAPARGGDGLNRFRRVLRGSSGFHRVLFRGVLRGSTGFRVPGSPGSAGFRAEPCEPEPRTLRTRWNRTLRNPVEPCGTLWNPCHGPRVCRTRATASRYIGRSAKGSTRAHASAAPARHSTADRGKAVGVVRHVPLRLGAQALAARPVERFREHERIGFRQEHLVFVRGRESVESPATAHPHVNRFIPIDRCPPLAREPACARELVRARERQHRPVDAGHERVPSLPGRARR